MICLGLDVWNLSRLKCYPTLSHVLFRFEAILPWKTKLTSASTKKKENREIKDITNSNQKLEKYQQVSRSTSSTPDAK
jgi:hypothetical protein